ncbi:MAG: hypothetical protein Q9219_001695 [cf. Caloplaca sp. 3 TL-2023]
MAVLGYTVAKSHNVKEAALNLAAKANDVRQTTAAVWDMAPTAAQPPSPEATFSLNMTNDVDESVVEGDERTLVDKIHFAPGGKYRSIVKLFIHYEFQEKGGWAMGTGWLITPDILVTAGHCSYDWSHKLGRATEVKAYIGYDGRQSEKSPDVQFRQAKRVATTEGWITTRGQKPFDVSFMQLQKPFTGVTPFKFEDTPANGRLALGVVGYPGDKIDRGTNEKGAHMYEMFLPTEYDLSTQKDTMLEYQIDTFGGNSGSPVLRQKDLVSIGAHVYGGTINSASVIGKYGNPYKDYMAAFSVSLPNGDLNLIPVSSKPNNSSLYGGYDSTGFNSTGFSQTGFQPASFNSSGFKRTNLTGQRREPRNQQFSTAMPALSGSGQLTQHPGLKLRNQHEEHGDEEFFGDVLKVVASAVPAAIGMIGGGPIGAIAGFALNAASSLVQESSDAESIVDASAIKEGSMERAILAEATLQALQSGQLSPELEEGMFSDIKDAVMGALPVIRKTAPRVMGAMMEPALKIALESLQKYNQKASGGAEAFEDNSSERLPTILYSHAIDQPADHQAEAFVSQLQAAMRQNLQESALDGDAEEGWLDIIAAGGRLAARGVAAAAKHGLPLLVDMMKGGAESFEDGPTSNPNAQLLAAEPLAVRALVADAALNAVMKAPVQQLQEEGIFDFLGSCIKTIAPVAMKFAPAVAGAIHPAIGKIVGGVLGQESAFAGRAGGAGRTKARLDAPAGLSSKRSFQSLRIGDGNAQANGAPNRFGNSGFSRYAE